jgi:hypothetical protein
MPEGTSQTCPACGINVMRGYAKCPKCHAPMPGNAEGRARRPSFGGAGGGTSSQPIETIDTGGGGGGWIWAIVGVVIVAGVIAFVATRGGDSKKPAQSLVPVDNGPGTAAPPTQPDNEPAQLPPSQNRPDPAYVADALEGELSVARLFAVVEVSDTLLDVRSAFCTDPRFSEIAAKYIADLKAAGVTTIRCSETHGAQVFERPL